MKNRSIKIINIITLASILIGGFWPLAATHSALTSTKPLDVEPISKNTVLGPTTIDPSKI